MTNPTGRLRVTVVPENDAELEQEGKTLAERLKGRVGRFDFGEAHLSEDTGRKFADALIEERQTGEWKYAF